METTPAENLKLKNILTRFTFYAVFIWPFKTGIRTVHVPNSCGKFDLDPKGVGQVIHGSPGK